MASYSIYSQPVPMEVDGGIKIGDVTSSNLQKGTIRFSDGSFQGWNGFTWVALSSFNVAGEVSDYDGNTYPTVQIGAQVWMAENLLVQHYNDGDLMQVQNGIYIINYGATGTLHYPNNSASNLPIYGGLYDFYCIQTDKLCPSGWHVPTDVEFEQLANFLGGEEVAGLAAKEVGSAHWSANNQGQNTSGFTARGAGRWHETPNAAIDFTYDAYFWTSTYTTGPVFVHFPSSGIDFRKAAATSRFRGKSVRCVKN